MMPTTTELRGASSTPLIAHHSPEGISVEAAEYIHPKILNRLGLPVSGMFPEFTASFPKTVKAMETHWPRPAFWVCTSTGPTWKINPTTQKAEASMRTFTIGTLGMMRGDLNLFIDVVSNSPVADDPDEYLFMLPTRWRDLYQWLESFCVKSIPAKGIGWYNTPTSFSGRIRPNEFCQLITEKTPAVKKKDMQRWLKIHGLSWQRSACWLLIEDGDSLWIDEALNNQQVYHMQYNNFESAYMLPDPGETLDRYMAHVVSGGDPKEFSFRD